MATEGERASLELVEMAKKLCERRNQKEKIWWTYQESNLSSLRGPPAAQLLDGLVFSRGAEEVWPGANVLPLHHSALISPNAVVYESATSLYSIPLHWENSSMQ